MKTNPTDPFGYRPPPDYARVQIEDRACRAALKVAGIPPTRVVTASGLQGATPKLTFDVLIEYADFPMNPVVTAEGLDDLLTLMTKFDKSRLWAAWLKAWDTRPAVKRGERMLVLHGPVTGFVFAYDSAAPPDRPHLTVGHSVKTIIYVEPLSAWCRGVRWATGE